MASETEYPQVRHSLPIPKMYPQPNTSPGSSSTGSPPSTSTTPSGGFSQPWLSSAKTGSPAEIPAYPGTTMPTPPSSSSIMQQQMNMMHPIYMYSSPYFQYPHNMVYPYSSMFPPQMMPAASQPAVNDCKPPSPKASPASLSPPVPTSVAVKDFPKMYPSLSSAIPQAHSYAHLTTTPVHEQLPRSGDRRNSLSSECSSSPSEACVSRVVDTTVDTDISVDGPTSDSDLSRINDSGNSSLGSEPVPVPEPVSVTKQVVKKSVTPPSPEPLYKKKARTNYTPEQVRGLEKVFLETPYPEPEVMEKLSQDLDIPEQKLKVWFQNKRARWRRRVQDTKHPLAAAVPSVYMPSMMSPYGFMPPTAMPQANPMMPGAYYPYQHSGNAAFNSPMQKFGFPCMY